jgi:broad specificity phosphatase PhoE
MKPKDRNVDEALFLLVRHGASRLNDQDRYRGWSDDDSAALDKKGIREAKIAGRFISKLPIKIGVIFCSDLDRTLHTAALIGRIIGIDDIHISDLLKPINVGIFTGESKEEYPADYYIEHPDVPFPGGETISEFRDRQKQFSKILFEWIDEHPTEKPLVVGHLSTVIYWEDEEKAISGYLKNYATDKEDLIKPGGVTMVMPDGKVIALLGENKKAQKTDEGDE